MSKTLGTALGAVGLMALVAGCPAKDIACTDIAVSSVTLTVEDDAGNAIVGATGSFTVDGGAAEDCEPGGQDGEVICGFEKQGAFEITVSAEGYEAQVVSLSVDADECHVIPEARTVTLSPDGVDCTEQAVPSILVVVEGASEETLTGVAVTYAPEGGDDPAACTEFDGQWTCGTEEAGTFVVSASADGHTTETATVTVEMDEDGCHVVTEEVTLTLEYLPD